MKISVGLGNPGPRYARSRHNVGFQCVDEFARRHHILFSSRRPHVVVGAGEIDGASVAIAKPRTYMNESGLAIAYLVQRFHVSPSDFVIVYDDLDLPPGRIRLRSRGSSGGHRGMESVLQALGDQEVPRLRVGIGRPAGGDEIKYVLGAPGPEEESLLRQAREQVADALLCLLTEGLERAMNRFNTQGPA